MPGNYDYGLVTYSINLEWFHSPVTSLPESSLPTVAMAPSAWACVRWYFIWRICMAVYTSSLTLLKPFLKCLYQYCKLSYLWSIASLYFSFSLDIKSSNGPSQSVSFLELTSSSIASISRSLSSSAKSWLSFCDILNISSFPFLVWYYEV